MKLKQISFNFYLRIQ